MEVTASVVTTRVWISNLLDLYGFTVQDMQISVGMRAVISKAPITWTHFTFF